MTTTIRVQPQLPKFFLIVLLTVVAALVVLKVVIRTNEPMYQGRPLSHWLKVYHKSPSPRERAEARNAVLSIGVTNALPYLLKTIRLETPTWRQNLRGKVSPTVQSNGVIASILHGESDQAFHAVRGFEILGTNANVAVPDLTILVNNTNALRASQRAIAALSYVGMAGFPALTNLLSNTNYPRVSRSFILYKLVFMAKDVGTNRVLPILLSVRDDPLPEIRQMATFFISKFTPEIITNGEAEGVHNAP